MSEFRKFQDDVMVDEALQDQLDTLIANPDFNDESLIEFAEQNEYQIMQEELDGVVETISNELPEDVVGGTGAAGSQLDQDWPGAGKVQARIVEEFDIDSLIALGAEHGCEFSAEDLAENAELSDEELDGVAGGALAIYGVYRKTSSGPKDPKR